MLAIRCAKRLKAAKAAEAATTRELRQAQQGVAANERAAAAFGVQRRQLAHGMRNPLSSIVSFASLIEADPTSSRVKEWASYISAGADELDPLIDSLFDLTIGNDGLESVPIFEVVQSTVTEFAQSQPERNIDAVVKSSIGPEQHYLANERQIRNAVAALLATDSATAAEQVFCSLERTKDLGDDIDQVTLTLVTHSDRDSSAGTRPEKHLGGLALQLARKQVARLPGSLEHTGSTADGRETDEFVVKMELRRLIA